MGEQFDPCWRSECKRGGCYYSAVPCWNRGQATTPTPETHPRPEEASEGASE